MAKRKQPGLYPTKGVRVNAETRRYQMLELTKAGHSEKKIAEQLGVAKSLVNREMKRLLGDLARSATKTADLVRALQMERYEALLSRYWLLAMQGDAAAALMVLKIMKQIDKINGIIPDRPLISMVDNRSKLQVKIGDDDPRVVLDGLISAIATRSDANGSNPAIGAGTG